MKQKRAFTLLEIMIVIFLIGLIGSVIGYNMKGSMDEGKAFKTEQAMKQLDDIFELAIAKGFPASDIKDDPEKYLADSGLVKKPGNLMKDGWGKRFDIEVHDDSLTISSTNYNRFLSKKLVKKQEDED